METSSVTASSTPTPKLGALTIETPDLTVNDWGSISTGQYMVTGSNLKAHRCEVEIEPGITVAAYLLMDHPDKLFVQPMYPGRYHNGQAWHDAHLVITEVDEPFITVEVLSTATSKTLTRKTNQGYGRRQTETFTDTYDPHRHNEAGWHGRNHNSYHGRQNNPDHVPFQYVTVCVTYPETGATWTGEMRFQRPTLGKVTLNDTKADFGGSRQRTLNVRATVFGTDMVWEYECWDWEDFAHLLTSYDLDEPAVEWWAWWFAACNSPISLDQVDTAAVKSVWNRKAHRPVLAKLLADEPLLHRYLLWLHSKKNQDGTSNNKLLAAFLKAHASDFDKLRDALRASMEGAPAIGSYRSKNYSTDVPHRGICLALPGADERERLRREKKEWNFRKGAKAQAEGLGLDPDLHPILLAAVEAGNIPISVFHEPGNEKDLINIEFELWERALSMKGWAEPLYGIAQNASRRGTYSKRVTSYLSFLFKLPRYLDKHASRGRGKKNAWRAQPKFVESQWELEMDETDDGGTTNKRSALTPVADNDTGIITIPYCAMAVHGRMTTWCYSDRYYVAEEGMNDPIGNGVFTSDLEVKLNGRDDYGLMWYTLMGTDRNTGYPSFLIIFERLPTRKDLGIDTRVHFHRVHPCRSKKGIMTPTNRLVADCYRYMAGNVTVDQIDAQQGDLIFIRVDKPGKAVEEPLAVRSFESHAFQPLTGDVPVKLIRSVAKSPTNRLGYLHSDVAFKVAHPEHEDIDKLDAGWWEVRRCKSYENNPTAVWSMTID